MLVKDQESFSISPARLHLPASIFWKGPSLLEIPLLEADTKGERSHLTSGGQSVGKEEEETHLST